MSADRLIIDGGILVILCNVDGGYYIREGGRQKNSWSIKEGIIITGRVCDL